MLKRFLSIFLTCILLLSAFSAGILPVYAEDTVFEEQEYSDEFKQYLTDRENGDTDKYNGYIPRAFDTQPPATSRSLKGSYASSFDSRGNYSTPVEDQGRLGTCWAFSANGLIENYVSKTTGVKNDYSEEYLRFYASDEIPVKSNGYFYRWAYEGGNFEIASASFTGRNGPVYSSEMPYSNDPYRTWPSDQMETPAAVNVTGTKTLGRSVEEIKEGVERYGSVEVSMRFGDGYTLPDESEYYNKNTFAYYMDTANYVNHSVLVCGWDDNFSVSNFNKAHRPKNNGAWLCKNSWGEEFGEKGYFWLSYEDMSAYVDVNVVTGVREASPYNKIYSYDSVVPRFSGIGVADEHSYIYAANTFNFEKNQVITECMFYYGKTGVSYEVYIVPSGAGGIPAFNPETAGTPAATGTFDYSGYRTVSLDTPYTVPSNGSYSVILKIGAAPGLKTAYYYHEATVDNLCKAVAKAGESWLYLSGQWKDTKSMGGGNGNICIRAVVENPLPTVNTSGISLDKTSLNIMTFEKSPLTANVSPADATYKNVVWRSSNPAAATVSQSGVVTAVWEGTAEITASTLDGKNTAQCSVTVTNPNFPVTEVNISWILVNLKIGSSDASYSERLLEPVFNPSYATNQNVTWSCEDESVISLTPGENNSVIIRPLAVGTTKVTVTTEDGGFTSSCIVNVTEYNEPQPLNFWERIVAFFQLIIDAIRMFFGM